MEYPLPKMSDARLFCEIKHERDFFGAWVPDLTRFRITFNKLLKCLIPSDETAILASPYIWSSLNGLSVFDKWLLSWPNREREENRSNNFLHCAYFTFHLRSYSVVYFSFSFVAYSIYFLHIYYASDILFNYNGSPNSEFCSNVRIAWFVKVHKNWHEFVVFGKEKAFLKPISNKIGLCMRMNSTFHICLKQVVWEFDYVCPHISVLIYISFWLWIHCWWHYKWFWSWCAIRDAVLSLQFVISFISSNWRSLKMEFTCFRIEMAKYVAHLHSHRWKRKYGRLSRG